MTVIEGFCVVCKVNDVLFTKLKYDSPFFLLILVLYTLPPATNFFFVSDPLGCLWLSGVVGLGIFWAKGVFRLRWVVFIFVEVPVFRSVV